MNRPSQRTDGSRRLSGDSGVVLIEFAMVFPFLMLLSMGVLEFGFIYRSNIMVSDATNSTIRSLANFGPKREADYNSLMNAVAGLSTLPAAAEVKRVVVYNADAAPSQINNCKTMTVTPGQVVGILGVCNVYSGGALEILAANKFDGATCDAADWDYWFCPTTRNDKLKTASPITAIGLYIDVRQESLTHMFPWISLQLDEQRVMHLEPYVGTT